MDLVRNVCYLLCLFIASILSKIFWITFIILLIAKVFYDKFVWFSIEHISVIGTPIEVLLLGLILFFVGIIIKVEN